MDLHPSREMVASGQRAGRNRKTQAHIRIWSTETLQTLYVFGMGEFEIGVSAVAFSQLVSKLTFLISCTCIMIHDIKLNLQMFDVIFPVFAHYLIFEKPMSPTHNFK